MSIDATVEVKDFEKIRIRLDDMSRHLTEELLDELEDGALQIRNRIIRSIQQSPADPSRPYTAGGKKAYRSQPGKPPKVDTGAMLASIRSHSKIGKDKAEIRVGSWLNKTKGAKYPAYLESGTRGVLLSKRSGARGAGGMKARPWLEPAMEKEWPGIKRRLSEIMGQEIKRATRGV